MISFQSKMITSENDFYYFSKKIVKNDIKKNKL